MQEGDEVIQGCPCRQCFEVELPSPVLILRRAGRVATRTDEQRVKSRIVTGFPGETGLEAGRSERGGRGSPGALPRKRRRRGEAQTSSAGGPEVYLAAGVDAETQEAAPRRSARVAARTVAQHVRSRIVSGFAEERVEDVAADETRRIAEGARRGDARRDEGTRGRMTSFSGEDLDRGAGGVRRAGRR